MPASFSVDVKGMKKLQRIANDIQSSLPAINEGPAKLVLRAARSFVPVRTGTLQSSLNIVKRKKGKGVVHSISSPISYAERTEQDVPYLRPATELNRKQIIKLWQTGINKRIAKHRI